MSAPSTMTCERCSELITELVCGELDAAGAAAVRAHAEQCPNCGPELASFARVLDVAQSLPLETPSLAVEQRIMQAAREAAARRATGAQAIESGTPSGGLRGFFERLAIWAMSPQVAMASVLLLVVGIGLYALPFGPDADTPSSLQIAQETEVAATRAPAASAASAPVTAEHDEADEEPAAEAPAPPAALPASGGRALAEERERANVLPEAKLDKAAPTDDTLRAARRPSKAVARSSGGALDDLGDLGGAYGAGAEGSFAPAPPPAEEARKDKKESAPEAPAAKPSFAQEAPAAASDAYAASPVTSAPAPKGSVTVGGAGASLPDFAAQHDEGVRAAQAGDHARAIALLEPVVAKGPAALRTSARRWLARSLRDSGDCVRALPHYAILVANQQAARAVLDEAADCYDRTGQGAQAKSLRARATKQ